MIHPVATDIIKLLSQLIRLLQPFAKCHNIVVEFNPGEKELILLLRPDLVILDITTLLCNIISYMPRGNKITITADIEEKELKIQVNNTGINLSLVNEIARSCRHPLVVKGNREVKQTVFEWSLPVNLPEGDHKKSSWDPGSGNKKMIPKYYDEIRNRLRSHFSKGDNLVAQLSIMYPREAAFLQKINAVIVANMENELFDATALNKEMNMSRTSLFRRLKPLIQQAPATYIKSIRLQKAKELLETTDISVGDAAFKTGFQTQSHFSKAFADMFGFLPSTIRRKNRSGTKE
jgi:AraC-like DNA-binding protein